MASKTVKLFSLGLFIFLNGCVITSVNLSSGIANQTNVVLEKDNFSYTAQGLVANGQSVYILGVGGWATKGLVSEAMTKLKKNHKLNSNEALVNVTIDTRLNTFLGIVTIHKCFITADVVKFTSSYNVSSVERAVNSETIAKFTNNPNISYIDIEKATSLEPSIATLQTEQNIAPSPQRQVAVKQPLIDSDYEKRQKSVVKYTNDLPKIEKALSEIKYAAPAAYEVGNLSVDFLKLLNRVQEEKTFDFNEVLPLILKATFMSLPPGTINPSMTIDTNIAAKLFPFLTVDFKMPSNQAVDAINSALKSWNGKSVWSIKDEMTKVAPAQKVKVGMLLKSSIEIFAAAIPQLNVTVKSSL
ncbi:MAG: hypothetical protein FWF51_03250 [Chitinivibrionia bacterium]|nr:hypothetical protein [Chitinivibrionia bacterium]